MMKVLLLACVVCGCLGSKVSWGPLCPTPPSLNQVLDKLASDERIDVSEGVRFVKVNGSVEEGEGGRSSGDSILERVNRFFTSHELQVKLADVFQKKQNMVDTLWKAVGTLNELQEENEETSRGKGHGGGGFGGGKKGGSPILMMATMMGGTMAALGFGALAMLVMKALTVSSMALLLSAVLGLRRLLRRPDDDAGFGRISYIPVHTEHRKKRSLQDLPYRAYVKRR